MALWLFQRSGERRGVLAWLLVALLVSGPSPVAGQPPWVFPIHHESPSWSSTGLIAFLDNGIVSVDDGGAYQTSNRLAGIWVLDPETGNKQLVLPRSVVPWVGSPDWSPDGARLVVSNGHIHTLNADGTGLTDLTPDGESFFSPAWSPDGEWIAFWSLPGSIWIMRADGTERHVIGPTGAWAPEWRPDGSLIVHIRGAAGVATMTPEGNDIGYLMTTGSPSNPEYSPNGQQIAYQRETPESLPQIWVMNADGSGQRPVTTVVGTTPSWSPDGTKIVFSREDWSSNAPEVGVLWVVDVATGAETQLTHKWHVHCAAWPHCEATGVEPPVDETAGSRPRIWSMNPIKSEARLRVWLPSATGMRLEIYDVSGRPVRMLHQGQMPAGGHEFTWDGMTASGGRASSGLYFARLQAVDRVVSHKLVVLR
jgi:hypothetical protein